MILSEGSFGKYSALGFDLMDAYYEIYKEYVNFLQLDKFINWHEKIYKGTWQVVKLRDNFVNMECLKDLPTLNEFSVLYDSWIKNMGFSRLGPNTTIQPHVGYTNKVLRLHLGLEGCLGNEKVQGLRVGDQKVGWQMGKVIIFDDAQEHEAWNFAEKDRVVLLLDIIKN